MTGATPVAPKAPQAPSLGKPEMKRTREGFGHGLVDLGEKRSDVVVLVGDLSGSTNVTFFAEKFPDRFSPRPERSHSSPRTAPSVPAGARIRCA